MDIQRNIQKEMKIFTQPFPGTFPKSVGVPGNFLFFRLVDIGNETRYGNHCFRTLYYSNILDTWEKGL